MKILFLLVLIFLLNLLKVQGHSFMKCVNYDFGTNTCKAYPRNYKYFVERGDAFLFQRGKFTKPVPTELGQACGPAQRRTSPPSLQYSSSYPMGVFKAGQVICPQWPARNHANQLRAGTVSFYLSNKMRQADTIDNDQSTFFNNPIHSSPFGNCTKYFENTNNSTCTSCFRLPNNVADGLYVLQFFWEFNPKEYYLTCADIIIGNDGNSAYSQNYQQQSYPQQQAPREHVNDEREYNSQRIQEERLAQQRLDQEKEQERYRQQQIQQQIQQQQQQQRQQVDKITQLNNTPFGSNIQYVLDDGELSNKFVDISRGKRTSKQNGYYEMQPIPGEALFFECSGGVNCIDARGKTTLNIKLNSYKSILEDTDISLLVAGESEIRSVSLFKFTKKYEDTESATVRIPLSEFGSISKGYKAIAFTGFNELNDDYVNVESISFSN